MSEDADFLEEKQIILIPEDVREETTTYCSKNEVIF